MTVNELMTEITSKLNDLEVSNGNILKSRAIYEKRMSTMKDIIKKIDDCLEENNYQYLIDLKNKINSSITIMELADLCGVINEP